MRQAFAGDVLIASDMCPTVSATIGRWYVELLFEVCDKRPPISEVTALTELKAMLALLPPEHRKPFLLTFIGPRVVDQMLKPYAQKPAVPQLAQRIGLSEDLAAYSEFAGVDLIGTAPCAPQSSREICQQSFGSSEKPKAATGIPVSAFPIPRGK